MLMECPQIRFSKPFLGLGYELKKKVLMQSKIGLFTSFLSEKTAYSSLKHLQTLRPAEPRKASRWFNKIRFVPSRASSKKPSSGVSSHSKATLNLAFLLLLPHPISVGWRRVCASSYPTLRSYPWISPSDLTTELTFCALWNLFFSDSTESLFSISGVKSQIHLS